MVRIEAQIKLTTKKRRDEMSKKELEIGTKVVLRGQKITGTFRQFLGENEEDMVILLTKPQKDGAQTIICPTSEVEVLKANKKKANSKKKTAAKK